MSSQPGVFTYAEILSQPEVWRSAVDVFQRQVSSFESLWRKQKFDSVILSGCGSTYYLALAGAALFQQMGHMHARAYPASEIALLPDLVFAARLSPLFIAISRSGETTETLEAQRIFRERTGNPVMAVTCAAESALSQVADLSVSVDAAQEQSVAQTRSFASMMLIVQAMAAQLTSAGSLDVLQRLPSVIHRLLDQYHDLARQLGQERQLQRFFFLGSGPLYGIACEAMLKMKEMSLSYSEAFHVLEFRHGPMSMVNENALVVILISDEAHKQEIALLRQMQGRGVRVLAISDRDYGLTPDNRLSVIVLDSGLPPWARPVLYLPILQLMAYYRALAQGQNPDQPENLEFVISLNDSLM